MCNFETTVMCDVHCSSLEKIIAAKILTRGNFQLMSPFIICGNGLSLAVTESFNKRVK